MPLTDSEKRAILADWKIGLPTKFIAAEYGISPHSVRRMASQAGAKKGELAKQYKADMEAWLAEEPESAPASAPEAPPEDAPAFTRRCRNKHCIERFVPVNSGHWFHEPACADSADKWSKDDILREEGSLMPDASQFEMVKRAFGQKNQLVRKVTTLTSQREYLAFEVANFYRDNPEYRWPPVAPVTADLDHYHGQARGERSLVVQLSDWQLGKLENGIGIDEMRRRVDRIKNAVRSVVERQRLAGYEVFRVTLSYGGDMIEGCYIYGGQNVTGLDRTANTQRLTTQIRVAAHLIAEVAYDVAQYVDEVFVEAVPGNHGRPNGRNDFADPEDNFDLMATQWASDITAHTPRIQWGIHENWWGAFDVLGHRFVSFHGDQWRGPFQKLEDLLPKWVTNDVFGPKPEVVLTHHRHDVSTLRVGGMFVCQNGTIDGGSQWYLKAFGKASPPTQVIHVVSERRATESLWFIDFK